MSFEGRLSTTFVRGSKTLGRNLLIFLSKWFLHLHPLEEETKPDVIVIRGKLPVEAPAVLATIKYTINVQKTGAK